MTTDFAAPKRVGSSARALPPASALLLLATLLTLACALSLVVGSGAVTPSRVIGALFAGATDDAARSTVLFVRLPRTVLAALVGAALAVAGALMQLLTRNPLASAQTLGINGCAALAMVLTIVAGGAGRAGFSGPLGIAPAFIGAACGAALVLIISAGGTRGPVVLTLAGVALQLLTTALVEAVTTLNDAAVDVVFWLNGSVGGAQWEDVGIAAPGIAFGIAVAIAAFRPLHVLALGRETVLSLGQHYSATAIGAAGIVVVLAGTSVAVAGPIGFVGLIVPHLVRAIVGRRAAWEFPLCAMGGAALLVLADTGARLVLWPAETPAGVVTAVIGAPLFLVLIRRTLRGRA